MRERERKLDQPELRSILVVEDNEGLRNLIIKRLQRVGYKVEGTGTGTEALEIIQEKPEQVLLLDQTLPDLTGVQIIHSLKEKGLDIPFIFMTGQGDEQFAVETMKLGAADYLVKGQDLIDLIPGTIQRLFRELRIKKRLQEVEKEVIEAEHRLREQYELAISLSKAQTLEETLQLSLKTALRATGLDCGGIYLLDETSDGLTLMVHQGLSQSFIEKASYFHQKSHQFHLAMSGKSLFTSYQKMKIPIDPSRIQEGLRGIAIVPIFFEGELIALFNMASHTQDEILQSDRITLESIAAQISSFIARMNVEEKIKERESKYRAVFEGIHDAIILFNEKGVFLDSNNQAVTLFDLNSKEDFKTYLPFDLFPLYQEDGRKSNDVFLQYIKRAKENKEHIFFEWLHKKKNEETFLGEVILTAYALGEETIIQITIRDITHRKMAESEIKARNKELTSFYQLSTHMRAAKDSNHLLPLLLDEVLQLVDANTGMVALLSPEEKHLRVSVAQGYWEGNVNQILPVDKVIKSIVLKNGKPYVTPHYGNDPFSQSFIHIIGPAAFVPLQSEENILGILLVARYQTDPITPFSDSEVHLLTAIGEMAGNALRRQVLHENSQEQMKQLQALRKIDMAITSNLDLQSILKITLNQVTQILNVDAAAILRLYPDNEYKYIAGHGFYSTYLQDVRLNANTNYSRLAFFKKEARVISNIHQENSLLRKDSLFQREGFVGYGIIPLVTKNKINGFLEVFHRQPLYRNKDWQKVLESMAGQAAIAIDNDHLFTSLEYANMELTLAYNATIEGWAYALDLRDEETEGHSQRVAQKTIMLAMAIDVQEEEMIHLRRGALLHDIGKMGIPDSILLKPGKLTEKEWQIMRRHPQYAWKMLHPIEYLRPALNIPLSHHERWDGGGYPHGLKGENIPLEARIFAVVDVYDALTSNRSYRPAWKKKDALDLIDQEKEKHFDPVIAQEFLKLFG